MIYGDWTLTRGTLANDLFIFFYKSMCYCERYLCPIIAERDDIIDAMCWLVGFILNHPITDGDEKSNV